MKYVGRSLCAMASALSGNLESSIESPYIHRKDGSGHQKVVQQRRIGRRLGSPALYGEHESEQCGSWRRRV